MKQLYKIYKLLKLILVELRIANEIHSGNPHTLLDDRDYQNNIVSKEIE